jgi:hypothetical protein
MRIRSVLLPALVLLALLPSAARAETFLEKMKRKAEEKIDRRVDHRTDQAIDKSIDAAENAIKCAATDTACIEKAQKSGK